MVALIREGDFARLAGALGQPELADDPRYRDFSARAENAAGLVELMRARFATETTADWLERLRAADLLADRVNGFDDWLADPHVVATGGAVTVDHPDMGVFQTPRTPGVPAAVDAAMLPAPRIGQHGREIVAELGMAGSAIARLAAEGVLFLPDAP